MGKQVNAAKKPVLVEDKLNKNILRVVDANEKVHTSSPDDYDFDLIEVKPGVYHKVPIINEKRAEGGVVLEIPNFMQKPKKTQSDEKVPAKSRQTTKTTPKKKKKLRILKNTKKASKQSIPSKTKQATQVKPKKKKRIKSAKTIFSGINKVKVTAALALFMYAKAGIISPNMIPDFKNNIQNQIEQKVTAVENNIKEVGQIVVGQKVSQENFLKGDGTDFFGYLMANEGNDKATSEKAKRMLEQCPGVNHIIIACGVYIDDNGQVIFSKPPVETIKELKANGVEVGLMVKNGEWNGAQERTHKFFTAEDSKTLEVRKIAETDNTYIKPVTLRDKGMDEILKFAKENGFTSVNIDFENLYDSDEKYFTNFVTDTKAKASKKEYQLSVTAAIPPKWGKTMNQAFNYPQLAANCDAVIVMFYDENGCKGRLSSTKRLRDFNYYIKQDVPEKDRGKIIMAYGAYGYQVSRSGRYLGALPLTTIENMENYEKGRKIDANHGAPYIEVSRGSTIFLEDEKSIGERIDLCKDCKYGGSAVWALNYIDDRSLTQILDAVNAGRSIESEKEGQALKTFGLSHKQDSTTEKATPKQTKNPEKEKSILDFSF